MAKNVYTKMYMNWAEVPQVLNVKEVCQLLRISDVTAGLMLKKGVIKGNKIGREWRIDKDSLREYINGGKIA